jgi:hypothetical protein
MKVMIEKLKARFRGRLNESGALPAIMAGCILISATAVLLGGFSVTMTRNSEINSMKTNVNYYLNACENILETETVKALPSQFETETKQKIKNRVSDCNTPNTLNGGPIVKIYLVGDPVSYTPTGAPSPSGVKVTLGVDISKGSFKATGFTQVVKTLDYATQKEVTLTPDSFIDSFDSAGNAVWVTPATAP